ncbi:MAG: hypothetical protein NVS3B18_07990 [Candidatus Dormibacteria bacterium]
MTGAYELEVTELLVHVAAEHTADMLGELQAALDRDGVIGPDENVHPAAAELRTQRLTLAKLIATLRMPDDDGAVDQRLGGVRGMYAVSVAS